MHENDFQRLASLVQGRLGIMMPPSKKTMLMGRLRRRLSATGFNDYGSYCDYVFSPEGAGELPFLLDAVTTNKTDFFRESPHFDLLARRVLPDLAVAGSRPLRVWSAACSSGEEPYTLAMVLSEAAVEFEILATDVSRQVLERGRRAVYSHDLVQPVPDNLRRKYLLRSRDPSRRVVRVVPELRTRVRFQHLNFMEQRWPVEGGWDIIFCRNVLIYFDGPTKDRLVDRLTRLLAPGGWFFVSHTESFETKGLGLERIAPSVFRKVGA